MCENERQFTVDPQDGFLTADRRQIMLQLIEEQQLPRVPLVRVPQDDNTVRLVQGPLVIWNNEAEALEFAAELQLRTRSEWIVRELEE